MRDPQKIDYYLALGPIIKDIYQIKYPPEENIGLRSQIRRSATSIKLNIAEGCGRATEKDFAHFLYQAMGSLLETQSNLEISKDLGYISLELYANINNRLESIGKRLNNYIAVVVGKKAKKGEMDKENKEADNNPSSANCQ